MLPLAVIPLAALVPLLQAALVPLEPLTPLTPLTLFTLLVPLAPRVPHEPHALKPAGAAAPRERPANGRIMTVIMLSSCIRHPS